MPIDPETPRAADQAPADASGSVAPGSRARTSVVPGRFAALSAAQRRRALLWTALRTLVLFAAVLVLYFWVPLGQERGEPMVVARLVLALLLLVALVAWRVRRILVADLPGMRAVETLGLALPLFLVVYASAYVTMESTIAGSFNESLDKVAGLYLAIVTFGTVGYGDIVPVSNAARLLVASQVLIDVAFLAVIVRLLVTAVRVSESRSEHTGDPDAPAHHTGDAQVR